MTQRFPPHPDTQVLRLADDRGGAPGIDTTRAVMQVGYHLDCVVPGIDTTRAVLQVGWGAVSVVLYPGINTTRAVLQMGWGAVSVVSYPGIDTTRAIMQPL